MRKLILAAAVVFVSASSIAQDLAKDVDALKQQVEMLTNELANLKTNKSVTGEPGKSYDLLGESASKPYFGSSRVSLGGYGEIKFKEVTGGSRTTDTHRIIPYIGYRFTDDIIFNAEIEFEHGGANSGSGEAIVEFAYLDFLNVINNINIRVGHILIPMGLTNTKHEPTLFPSVNRPLLEKYVIPTTWHEDGIEFYESDGNLKARIGLVNSMDGSKFTSANKSNWIRSGRQGGNGSASKADDWSIFARVDYDANEELTTGLSTYTGKVNQAGAATGNPTLSIVEAHVQWQSKGWLVNALYAEGMLSDADNLDADFGRQAGGYYVTLGYDIMRLIQPESTKQLQLFTRHSQYDLNKKVKDGTTVDDTLNKTATTVGLAFKPISNVVIKADYQYLSNAEGDLADETHLGIGFNF